MKSLSIIGVAFLAILAVTDGVGNKVDRLPVVMWHGMSSTCCDPNGLGHDKKLIEEHFPGIYVKSIMVGPNIIADFENSFLMNVNKQLDIVCEQLANDTMLAGGYNSVGYSQGGQFLRAVAQRCPYPPMHNLVTLASQHQGVFGLPMCLPENLICEDIRQLLDYGAYVPAIQNTLVQAEYWHDPLHEETYKEKSVFIAEINNEMDRLGLKLMEEENKLDFLTYNGTHVSFDDQWFLDEIVDVYFA